MLSFPMFNGSVVNAAGDGAERSVGAEAERSTRFVDMWKSMYQELTCTFPSCSFHVDLSPVMRRGSQSRERSMEK